MNRVDVLKLALIYLATLVGGSAVYVILFHTPLLAGMSVFFYRGIALLLLASLLCVAVLVTLARTRFRTLVQVRDILLITSLLFSGNIVFFTHFPVTADRSISVFMLGYMDEAGREFTSPEIEDVVVQQYVYDNGAVDKRLDEQVVSGDLVKAGDRYRISDQGRALMAFYRVVAGLFGLDMGNVSP